MMSRDEKLERSHTRGTDSLEAKEDTVSSFIRTHEHIPISFKAVAALVLTLPVCGIFIAGFVSNRFTLSTIDERIREISPTILQSVHDRISSLRENLATEKTRIDAHEKRLDKLEEKP